MRKTTVCGLGAALLFAVPALADETTQYTDRATFESALGTIVLDDFEAEAYLHGDVIDGDTVDVHTNAHMSGAHPARIRILTGLRVQVGRKARRWSRAKVKWGMSVQTSERSRT